MENKINTGGIQSISRAAAIVRYVAENDDSRLSDISSSLGLNINTVAGIINTLRTEGYLVQNPETKRLSLGNEILRLSSRIKVNFSSLCSPYLNSLLHETGETVNLARCDDDGIVYIEKLESPHSVRICTNVGIKMPYTCTAIGKAILAYLPPLDLAKILEKNEFPVYTSHTITSKELLFSQLETIRKSGLAYDMEELEQGLICVASPIFSYDKKPIAGVSVSGPSIRMNKKTLRDVSELVKNTAAAINEELSQIPPENFHKYARW